MDKSILKKVRYVKNLLKLKDNEINELINLYSGKPFNYENDSIQKLIKLSNSLCDKFEELGKTRHKTGLGLKIHNFKRLMILKKLFCGKYMVADVRSGIRLIIGLVDAKSTTFFNYNVHFGSALISIGRGVEIAPNVTFGESSIKQYASTGLPKIDIGNEVWIGIGSVIKNNVKIGEKSVIGAGEIVEESTPPHSLILGRPAKFKREISKKEKENIFGCGNPFSKEETDILYKAVTRWTNLNRIKYERILNGGQFNLLDAKLMKLYKTTHTIAETLDSTNPGSEIYREGINYLFPLRGENFKLGKNLHLDMIGTTRIGNNVTINSNVTLGGNLIFEDGCTIDDGACLFASGHPLNNKRRKMILTHRGIVQIGQNNLIVVKKNVHIGKNAIVTPGSIVDKDVPDNAIFAKNKII